MFFNRHNDDLSHTSRFSSLCPGYKDHLLYRNVPTPVEDAAERETIGWLTKENNELILIEHDRTFPYDQLPTARAADS